MTPVVIDITRPDCWPTSITDHFRRHLDIYLAWDRGRGDAWFYDIAIADLEAAVKPFAIRGWHCTRLTEAEIAEIEKAGMGLPSIAMLKQRIGCLVATGEITTALASRFLAKNRADDKNRAGMLWFCFFPPRRAGEGGIGRFFRHWGGEALYVDHEEDPESSSALRQIGVPCVVEAIVPISSIKSPVGLSFALVERMLRRPGRRIARSLEHEDAITAPLPVECVAKIHRHPEVGFRRLVGCDRWSRPIVV